MINHDVVVFSNPWNQSQFGYLPLDILPVIKYPAPFKQDGSAPMNHPDEQK